jgi:hypothetical protein
VKIELNRFDNLFGNTRTPVTNDSGTAFVFENVPPGEYSLIVSFVGEAERAPSPDLYVADIRLGGRSVAETGFEVGLDPTEDIEVVVGTSGARITGSVIGARAGQPLTVVLAPEISRRGNASSTRSVPVSAAGEFEFRGLRAGTYQTLAVPQGTPLSANRFYERAIAVVVAKGASVSGVKVPILSDGQ